MTSEGWELVGSLDGGNTGEELGLVVLADLK